MTVATTSVAASQEVATTEIHLSASTQQLIEPSVLASLPGFVLVALAKVLAIIISKRKGRAKQRKILAVPSRFCILCGKKIQANACFCGRCGATQG